jgi:hypothetical protein
MESTAGLPGPIADYHDHCGLCLATIDECYGDGQNERGAPSDIKARLSTSAARTYSRLTVLAIIQYTALGLAQQAMMAPICCASHLPRTQPLEGRTLVRSI